MVVIYSHCCNADVNKMKTVDWHEWYDDFTDIYIS